MDHSQSPVAILHSVSNHAQSQQIEDLIERPLLFLNFQIQRINPLDPRLHFRGNTVLDHFCADGFLTL